MEKSKFVSLILRSAACLTILLVFISTAAAQSEDELKEALVNSLVLIKAGRMLEAEPYLAKLVKAEPDSAELRVLYGTVLITKSKQISDNDEAKKAAALALEQFQAAKRLGSDQEGLDEMIKTLGGDPGTGGPAKQRKDTSAFDQAEVKFAQSNFDEALVLYKKALEADPKNYLAALYSADSLMQLKNYDEAEKYYQKAIDIDPDRETAYRYSATYLMKQKKYDQARDRYIEAFIAEPYGGMSIRGISQWAEVTGAKLGHPKVDIPEFKYDANGKPTTVINEASLTESSKAWLAYSLTRDAWHKEKFAKAFPKESQYRHTVQEEAEAIRRVLASAKDQKLSHPHFDILQKLDNEGLLEAFILLAHPDEGIAADYAEYRKNNRAKLTQYFSIYVIQK
ncbi:MAG: tetratricopeptide repeat protein [Acidobacteriota bacterium]